MRVMMIKHIIPRSIKKVCNANCGLFCCAFLN
jgi:hypothetical protein